MLEFYAGPTPNSRKIAIFLEETGLEHRVHHIDIIRGDQLTPEFLAINPNNKHPAIVDPDGPREPGGEPITLWESGAILLYLAEKTGRFLPASPALRLEALKWLFFQVANQGPMAGQFAHFAFYAKEKIPYAIERYQGEVNRQLGVLDRHLADHEYMADEYSIADMALLPYSVSSVVMSKAPRPHVRAWIDRLMTRPAVQRGLFLLEDETPQETVMRGMKGFGDEHRSILFGDRQFQER